MFRNPISSAHKSTGAVPADIALEIRAKEVLEESLNGYRIISLAPSKPNEAIDYYSNEALAYTKDYPEEHALIHFNLGKIYLQQLVVSYNDGGDSESRTKYVESALFHLRKALTVFTYSSYPIMFAVISTMAGQAFKERHYLIAKGSVLSRRGAKQTENLKMALEHILDAPLLFAQSKKHILEFAVCSLEIGCLYVFQLEELGEPVEERMALREHAISHLERAASLLSQVQASSQTDVETANNHAKATGVDSDKEISQENQSQRTDGANSAKTLVSHKSWNPLKPDTYPSHVKTMMAGRSLQQIEGLVNYYMGRTYHHWGGEKDCRIAFEHFSKCVGSTQLSLLTFGSPEWGDAHHRMASIIVQFPGIIDQALKNPKKPKKRRPSTAQEEDYFAGMDYEQVHPPYGHTFGNITATAPPDDEDRSSLPTGRRRVENTEGLDACLNTAAVHLQLATRCTALEQITSSSKDGKNLTTSSQVQKGGKTDDSRKQGPRSKSAGIIGKPTRPVDRAGIEQVDLLAGRIRILDVYCHLAQVYVARLSLILGKLGPGESNSSSALSRALCADGNKGLDLLTEIEVNLSTVVERAMSQEPRCMQDTYIALYASLKLAEVRLLSTAVRLESTTYERDAAFRDAVSLTLRALANVSVENGAELHYIAASLLSQIALSGRRYLLSTRTAAKAILSLSALVNRQVCSRQHTSALVRLSEDVGRLSGQGMAAISRDIIWSKRHPAALTLTESITPGYAFWCFEEEEEVSENTEYDVTVGRQNRRNSDPTTANATNQSYQLKPLADSKKMPQSTNSNKAVGDAVSKSSAIKTVTKLDLSSLNQQQVQQSPAQILVPGAVSTGVSEVSGRGVGPRARFSAADLAQAAAASSTARLSMVPPGRKHRRRVHSLAEITAARKQYEEEIDRRLRAKTSLDNRSDSDSDSDDDGGGGRRRVENQKSGDRPTRGENSPLEVVNEEDEGRDGDDTAGAARRSSVQKSYARKPVVKKSTFFSALFGGGSKVAPTSTPADPPPKSLKATTSNVKTLTQKTRRSTAPEVKMDAPISCQKLWASPLGMFATELLSRQARLQLILRCAKLQVYKGERCRNEIIRLPKEMYFEFRSMIRKIRQLCSELPVHWISSLKDLGTACFDDLQKLCSTQINNQLCDAFVKLETFVKEQLKERSVFLSSVFPCSAFLANQAAQGVDQPLFTSNADGVLRQLRREQSYVKARARTRNLMSARGGVSSARTETTDIRERGTKDKEKDKESGKSSKQRKKSVDSSTDFPSTRHLGEANWLDELIEEERVGKASFALSQCLDGTVRGSLYEFLDLSLQENECLLIFHLPSSSAGVHESSPSFIFSAPSSGLMAVLAWKGSSQTTSTSLPIPTAETATKGGRAPSSSVGGVNRGVVIEVAKSDADASSINKLLAAYIEALHARPAARRASQISDVLRAMSCAFALGELFSLLPTFVNSLIICCPPTLRIIPWHALLIEVPADTIPPLPPKDVLFSPLTRSNTTVPTAVGGQSSNDGSASTRSNVGGNVEAHLLERFLVRLGPSISLFELCWETARCLQHGATFRAAAEFSILTPLPELPMHRLCAIDGDSDAVRGAGLRAAKAEIACVASVFSGDPTDSTVLLGRFATPSAVRTSRWEAESREAAKERRREARVLAKQRAVMAIEGRKNKRRLAGGPNRNHAVDDEADEADEEELEKLAGSESSSDASEDDDRDVLLNTRYLEYCRVLHICANKAAFDSSTRASAAISLPEEVVQRHRYPLVDPEELLDEETERTSVSRSTRPTTEKGKGGVRGGAQASRHREGNERVNAKDQQQQSQAQSQSIERRSVLTTEDVVKQIHLRNCALCVLSKFGITDDLNSLDAKQIDADMEFLEAMHLAGAGSIMYPLWGGAAQGGGLGSLGQLLFLLQFYQALPLASRTTCAIGEAQRWAQLWLRNATGHEVLQFIQQADLPPDLRDAMATEMNAYISASTRAPPAPPGATVNAHSSITTSPPGERKFFSHPLLWGGFVVSGHGGNVHHPQLFASQAELKRAMTQRFGQPKFTEAGRRFSLIKTPSQKPANFAARPHDPRAEEEDLELEAAALRMEGKHEQAAVIEKRIAAVRRARVQSSVDYVKKQGKGIANWITDGLKRLDKALLEQDSEDSDKDEDKEEEDGNSGNSSREKNKNKKEIAGNKKEMTEKVGRKDTVDGDKHRPRRLRAVDPTESGGESVRSAGASAADRLGLTSAPHSPQQRKSRQRDHHSDDTSHHLRPLVSTEGNHETNLSNPGSDVGTVGGRYRARDGANVPIKEVEDEVEDEDEDDEGDGSSDDDEVRREGRGKGGGIVDSNSDNNSDSNSESDEDNDNDDDEGDGGVVGVLRDRVNLVGRRVRRTGKKLGKEVRSFAQAQDQVNAMLSRVPLHMPIQLPSLAALAATRKEQHVAVKASAEVGQKGLDTPAALHSTGGSIAEAEPAELKVKVKPGGNSGGSVGTVPADGGAEGGTDSKTAACVMS